MTDEKLSIDRKNICDSELGRLLDLKKNSHLEDALVRYSKNRNEYPDYKGIRNGMLAGGIAGIVLMTIENFIYQQQFAKCTTGAGLMQVSLVYMIITMIILGLLSGELIFLVGRLSRYTSKYNKGRTFASLLVTYLLVVLYILLSNLLGIFWLKCLLGIVLIVLIIAVYLLTNMRIQDTLSQSYAIGTSTEESSPENHDTYYTAEEPMHRIDYDYDYDDMNVNEEEQR